MPGIIEPEMRSYLAGEISSATNFYLRVAPNDTALPFATITKVSPGKDYTHSDRGSNSIYETRMRCSCFGEIYQDAKILAGEIIALMESWHTTESDVQAVFLENEVDLGEELDISHVALDFIVWNTF